MELAHSTLEKARKMRAFQGNHECEVSYGGESDLIQHFRRCKKNPGHSRFIPVKDFKKEHLPPGFHDNDIVDYIRAEADLTCRLRVTQTSKNRPKHWPGRPHLLYPFSPVRRYGGMRTGTGWIYDVNKYTEEDNKNCECEECIKPSTHEPHKVWGKIKIVTATHVVFNDDEARHTTCHFGYDTNKTWLSHCLKLTGFKVEYSLVTEDRCCMTYVTHDMDTVNKLYKMWRHSDDLWKKLYDKYMSNKNTSLSVPRVSSITDPKPSPVVIISHPHGLTKYITVGMWTDRQTWREIKKYKFNDDGDEADYVATSYTYNSHTCPGSSGAPVIRLPENGEWWWFGPYHPHSAGGEDNTNNNTCGVYGEIVSEPTRPEDK